jgi:hypothetical protein
MYIGTFVVDEPTLWLENAHICMYLLQLYEGHKNHTTYFLQYFLTSMYVFQSITLNDNENWVAKKSLQGIES